MKWGICAVAVFVPAMARANTPEDVYGASAATIAEGGAGTALPGDYSAVHYNPANLTHCQSNEVALDTSYIAHHLTLQDKDVNRPEPLSLKKPRNQERFMLGGCIDLPFDLTAGLMLGFGVPHAISLDQTTANEQPQFAMYGQANEQISIAFGLGWKATDHLSVGASFAALVRSQLPLTADFPILEPDPADPSGYKPVGFQLGLGMGGMIAPRLGVLFKPSARFRIGAAYRGALYHDLNVDAYIKAQLIIEIPVPVHVDSLSWFSPRQFSLGASGEPAPNLTIAADVTYYRWGELRQNASSYPFLNMYSLDPMGASGALVFPHPYHLGWKNNLAWRAGGELRTSDTVAVRAGLGFRTRGVNSPEDSNVNVLDAPVVTASAGIAWHKGSTTRGPTEPRPAKTTKPGRWWRYQLPNVSLTLNAFARVDYMLSQQVDHTTMPGDLVPEKHYEFGGQVFQLGGSAVLGW